MPSLAKFKTTYWRLRRNALQAVGRVTYGVTGGDRNLHRYLGLSVHPEEGGDIRRLKQLSAALDSADFAATEMAGAAELPESLDLLSHAMAQCKVEGLILEFGVFSARTTNHIASLAPGKVFGFDSFEGLPEHWREDYGQGAFKTKLPKVRDNVELVVGWFDQTLPGFLEAHAGPVSLLHVDCDLYSSTKTVFDLVGPRIVPGTVIVFDEYFNYVGWRQHEYRAFMEFIARSGLRFRYIGFVPTHQQVAAIIE